jgi:hypothetical protein
VSTQRAYYDASPGSIRPLVDTFWSSAGWRRPRNWPGEAELAAAVERGVMFAAPAVLDHDGWVEAARAAVARVSAEDVEAAFLTSLTSRRLDLRSALASYVIARGLPEHPFTARSGSEQCAICGLYAEAATEDLNVLNFERFKWGGVRRNSIVYVAFDLQQFVRAPRPEVRTEDRDLGRMVLDVLNNLPAETTATQAVGQLRCLKGNPAERAVLLDILGVCGILASAAHPGHDQKFVPAIERDLPPRRFVDRAYPVCWWTASEGVNWKAVSDLLPTLALR